MHWLAEALRQHPELALFLTLAIGYALGKLRIGNFGFGAVLGVLVAGVAIGQLGIPVSSEWRYSFFLLFLFAIGYKTGPQFFRGLRSSGLPQAGLTLLLAVVALATAVAVSKLLGFDAGKAAGLLAGGLTESATVGTAGDAIAKLELGEDARRQLLANVTVAFAVSYLVGMLTTVQLLSQLGPRLLRVDLAAECRKLEDEMGMSENEPGVVSAYFEFVMRAYEIPRDSGARSAAALEGQFGGERVFVERVRHRGRLLEARPETPLHPGDRIVLAGRRSVLVSAANPLVEHEVDDRELLDISTVVVNVVLTNKEFAGRMLGEIAREIGARGVFARKLARAGEELPSTPRTVVERGDVATLAGAKHHVEAAAARLGFAEWPSAASDMVTIGAAIVIGGLIGLPALQFGRLEIGLSKAVGVLLGGLVAGWLRSTNPRFGHVPEPALWLFDSFGLTAFLALVGLSAGPDFVRGLRESGLALVVAAIVVAAVPLIVTILAGKYLFRMHPGVLLGVCAGAATSGPGLAAVQEVAQSKIPTLGYGVSYAIGNVLLALWGSVVVMLMTA